MFVSNRRLWPLLLVGWLIVACSLALFLLPIVPATDGVQLNLVETLGPPFVLLALPTALIICHRADDVPSRTVGVGLIVGALAGLAALLASVVAAELRPAALVLAVIVAAVVMIHWSGQRRVAACDRPRSPLITVIIFSALLGLAVLGAVLAVVGRGEVFAALLLSIGCVLALALVSRTAAARVGWGSAVVGQLLTLVLFVLTIAITDETEFVLVLPILVVVSLLMWWHVRPALRRLHRT